MNDRELADAVAVILGAKKGEGFTADNYFLHHHGIDQYLGFNAESFVRDWRVAGALMEKVVADDEDTDMGLGWFEDQKAFYAMADDGDYVNRKTHKSDSLPRAIIEACVEALSGNQ